MPVITTPRQPTPMRRSTFLPRYHRNAAARAFAIWTPLPPATIATLGWPRCEKNSVRSYQWSVEREHHSQTTQGYEEGHTKRYAVNAVPLRAPRRVSSNTQGDQVDP